MPDNRFNNDPADEMSNSAANKINSGMANIGKRAGGKITREIGSRIGNKIKQVGKDLLKGTGRKIVSSAAQSGIKIVLKKYMIIGAGVLGGVFIAASLFSAMGDVLFEERGTTQNYSLENEEMNVSGVGENGVRAVVALTEPQALKSSYYRLMSCTSYTKLVNDEEDDEFQEYHFFNPENTKEVSDNDRADFANLQDYYENERYFLLSADFIMMADEILHDYTVYYPEQVIKPVVYEESESESGKKIVKTRKLVNDETHQLYGASAGDDADPIQSVKYEPVDGSNSEYQESESGEKVSGIWDYGLGSIISYEAGEKNVWREGIITTREVEYSSTDAEGNTTYWTVTETVNEPFKYSVPLEGKKDIKYGHLDYKDSLLEDVFENDTDVYPIKIPLISSAALFSGSIVYNYEVKETRTPFSEGATDIQSEDITRYAYTTDHNGNPLYEYRDGETVTRVPEKVSEEKDALGFDYIDDYYEQYVNYVPLGLKDDLNFEFRTKESEDAYNLLTDLGLLKPYTGEIGEVVQGPAIDLDETDATMDDSNEDYRSWNDVTSMAHLIAAEAGDSKLDELMVGAVVVNRWKNGDYTSLYDVISEGTGIGANRQYACFWTDTGRTNENGEKIYEGDGGTWAKATPTEREIESAKQVITGEFAIPSNVVYQSQSILGEVFMEVAPHYYCFPSGTTISPKDSFERAALTASQLQTLAKQLDGAGSSAEDGVAGGTEIGSAQTVEVTYYCSACNDPVGSDAIAWSGGPSNGHAVAGETCAMSEGSRRALGVEYGDWIYIEGVGTRRVEDLCGTGLGTSIKGDRIVVDVYLAAQNGVCKCNEAGTRTTTAYKTDGQNSTSQSGTYDKNTGLYYVDINNPYDYALFSAQVFDTYSATSSMENLSDPNETVIEKWFDKLGDAISDGLSKIQDMINEWGVMRGLVSGLYANDSIFTSNHFYVDTPTDLEKTHDVVYQALAITQNQLYSNIVSNFDENSMDLIFVGNYNPGGLFGNDMILVNGVGTTVDGFVSPTDSYYQPSETFSQDKPYVKLSTPTGTSVMAVYSGTVNSVASDSGTVVITHTSSNGDTYKITYGNIDPSVSNGAKVETKQVIGKTRDGGLTIKVEKNGKAIDPMTIFYQPTYSGGGSVLAQIAMNELSLHGSEAYPGETYQKAFGSGRGVAWCAYFVAYCAKQAGFVDADLYPWDGYCPSVRDWFESRGQFVPAGSGVVPQTGDPVLFDWGQDGVEDHIGIVLYYDASTNIIHTIEGNTSENGSSGADGRLAMKERTYDGTIVGFCKIGG